MSTNGNKTLYGAKTSGIAYSTLILVYVFLSLLVGVILNSVNLTSGTLYNLITCLVPILALIGVGVGVTKYAKIPLTTAVSINKFSPIYLLPTIMIAVGMLLGVGFINGLFSKFLVDIGVKVPESTILINGTGEFILYAVFVGLFPAVFEEAFFRGVMLNGLKNVKTVLSILFVGVCFSLYHASLLQLIYQFIYGVVLSFLTIKSKSVIPAIIAHLLNNVIVLVLTYFYGMSDVIMTPYLIVIGLLLLVGGVLFLAFYKRENTKKPDDKGETTKAFLFASAGLIVSLLIAIIGVF